MNTSRGINQSIKDFQIELDQRNSIALAELNRQIDELATLPSVHLDESNYASISKSYISNQDSNFMQDPHLTILLENDLYDLQKLAQYSKIDIDIDTVLPINTPSMHEQSFMSPKDLFDRSMSIYSEEEAKQGDLYRDVAPKNGVSFQEIYSNPKNENYNQSYLDQDSERLDNDALKLSFASDSSVLDARSFNNFELTAIKEDEGISVILPCFDTTGQSYINGNIEPSIASIQSISEPLSSRLDKSAFTESIFSSKTHDTIKLAAVQRSSIDYTTKLPAVLSSGIEIGVQLREYTEIEKGELNSTTKILEEELTRNKTDIDKNIMSRDQVVMLEKEKVIAAQRISNLEAKLELVQLELKSVRLLDSKTKVDTNHKSISAKSMPERDKNGHFIQKVRNQSNITHPSDISIPHSVVNKSTTTNFRPESPQKAYHTNSSLTQKVDIAKKIVVNDSKAKTVQDRTNDLPERNEKSTQNFTHAYLSNISNINHNKKVQADVKSVIAKTGGNGLSGREVKDYANSKKEEDLIELDAMISKLEKENDESLVMHAERGRTKISQESRAIQSQHEMMCDKNGCSLGYNHQKVYLDGSKNTKDFGQKVDMIRYDNESTKLHSTAPIDCESCVKNAKEAEKDSLVSLISERLNKRAIALNATSQNIAKDVLEHRLKDRSDRYNVLDAKLCELDTKHYQETQAHRSKSLPRTFGPVIQTLQPHTADTHISRSNQADYPGREMPFTVGKNTGKSFSVTANLQKVYSTLKSHNPDVCAESCKCFKINDQRAQQSKKNASPRVKVGFETSVKKLSDRLKPSSQSVSRSSKFPVNNASLNILLGELEHSFRESKMVYNVLANKYGYVSDSMSSGSIDLNVSKKKLKLIADELRHCILEMKTKSNQIKLLKNLTSNSDKVALQLVETLEKQPTSTQSDAGNIPLPSGQSKIHKEPMSRRSNTARNTVWSKARSKARIGVNSQSGRISLDLMKRTL